MALEIEFVELRTVAMQLIGCIRPTLVNTPPHVPYLELYEEFPIFLLRVRSRSVRMFANVK